MRTASALLVAATLAGCGMFSPSGSGTAPQAATAPPPVPAPSAPPASRPTPEPAGPSLAWHTALEGDTVLVELADATSHYRAEKVELVGPAGRRIAASQITREVERNYGYGPDGGPTGIGLNLFGSSSRGVGIGIGAGVPVGTVNYSGQPKTVTHARIALLDPVAYRANAAAWTIAVELIDKEGEAAFITIPAPAP